MSKTIESIQPPLLRRPVKVLNDAPLIGQTDDEYYEHRFLCMNCYERTIRWILKGVPVSDVTNGIVCDTCGCQLTKN